MFEQVMMAWVQQFLHLSETEKSTEMLWGKLKKRLHVFLKEIEQIEVVFKSCDCLKTSVFCPEFTWAEPKIVLSMRTEQF